MNFTLMMVDRDILWLEAKGREDLGKEVRMTE